LPKLEAATDLINFEFNNEAILGSSQQTKIRGNKVHHNLKTNESEEQPLILFEYEKPPTEPTEQSSKLDLR
jgi:hypothetical protein